MTEREPGSTIGRYVIRSVVGRGGLSTVYAAHDTLLDRDVAIKVFSSHATSRESIRLQEAEARLAGKLNHHALTTLYDAGVESTDPERPQIYLVMEHVVGADLKSRLQRSTLTPLQLSYLGTDLSSALAYVHENGFLHCDIKPANVLVSSRDEASRLRAKLTDFGIASIIGAHHGKGTTTGTAAYLAPEQIEGGEPTVLTDTYALGLVIIEAFTGRLEYPGTVDETALERLRRDPRIPAEMPRDLAGIVADMVARDPQKRINARVATERFERAAARLIAIEKGEQEALIPNEAGTASEPDRVSAVRRYGVLDTPPDEAFDRITRLASRMLDSPISFVSIVDSDRVFHKSRLGVDIAEVPREDSLCPITVEMGAPWYVSDIEIDERTKDNELLAANGVRAYAAAPLITTDGHSIGALCVYDTRPRTFSDGDLSDLSELAAIAMHELELRLAARRMAFERP
ncbi:MAG: protein kinase [Naasia sp.]